MGSKFDILVSCFFSACLCIIKEKKQIKKKKKKNSEKKIRKKKKTKIEFNPVFFFNILDPLSYHKPRLGIKKKIFVNRDEFELFDSFVVLICCLNSCYSCWISFE